MKQFFILILSCFACSMTAQTTAQSYVNKKGDSHLLGQFERSALQMEPYKEWYNKVYEKYEPNTDILDKVDEFYSGKIKVKIYLGTWCGDSKREVTRFLKIMDLTKIDPSDIEMIGLYGQGDHYKQGINREAKGLNIHRVPTFIFYEEEKEIARIVESPANTLEKDIAQIYAGLSPTPNYRVANYAGELFAEKTLVEADTILTQNARYLKRKVRNEGELNTMGYVLLAANEFEKAIVVFKLNTLLFPKSANTFDSLAEAFMKNGNSDLAVENYMRSLQLNGENENAVLMVKELASINGG